ncbi:Iron transporter-like protein [Halorhabdus tiamatea SARL4B]|uniref:ABC-type iron transporter, permease protein n=1 Tax=Halorhabdus tiamatea SARL4B TaxID=1033806 RepID=F7PFC4_9EURY|nr:iron ABC transporter permease [Halorhabdus tiamatea]ERJ05754.1 Iron transporter-like protein [Halorhabdus tiamatea SARL4B]CCQ33922.1 ABC-type iron transporter, permease protein [Halorhabdus tiamatea SARL4B]
MSREGRVGGRRERLSGAPGLGRPSGLTLLAAAIAVALVAPLGWLFLEVFDLGPRALELAVDGRTIEILLRSVGLVGVVTTASVLVGVPIALLTARTDLPFARLFTVLAALPLAIPSYLGALAVLSAFGTGGVLTGVLAPVGIEQLPEISGFAGAALVLTLYTYPYVLLTTRASLLSLDTSLIEAARTLDAGRLEAFRRVTLPQIAPGIAAGALLVALYTLADFGTPNFMGVEVFTQAIYARYNNLMRPWAALLSVQLLGVTAAILYLESQVGADDEGAYQSRGTRGGAVLELGAWRYVAALVPAVVAGLAVVLPVVVFGLWLTNDVGGYTAGGLAFSWTYGWNSVYLAALAAGGSLLVALPVAVAAARGRSRLAALADRVSYVGYATPGIVLAFALVLFALNALPSSLRTTAENLLVILVFAYVVRFVPQAIGAIRTATMQVDRRLIEAARTLGRTRIEAFRAVTLPLIAPGIATGAALVFLTTMKELPVTLLLRPFWFDHTLVTYIWKVREAGLYGRAAVPALALIAISGVSMAVILSQEGSNT